MRSAAPSLAIAGKFEIAATKPLANQRDLALAYSPGVAFPCQAIVADPHAAAYTARQNLVAVLTNGTAVLGLAAIGPLAAKPVMEGRAALFKKFAGIDVFDIELAEANVDKLVDIIAALEPIFGGINLEDIKGPQCFEVEEKAKARMLDAGSTALQLTRVIADALPVGPILIGPAKPAHVLTPTVTARGIVNMTAIAAVEAAGGWALPFAAPAVAVDKQEFI